MYFLLSHGLLGNEVFCPWLKCETSQYHTIFIFISNLHLFLNNINIRKIYYVRFATTQAVKLFSTTYCSKVFYIE